MNRLWSILVIISFITACHSMEETRKPEKNIYTSTAKKIHIDEPTRKKMTAAINENVGRFVMYLSSKDFTVQKLEMCPGSMEAKILILREMEKWHPPKVDALIMRLRSLEKVGPEEFPELACEINAHMIELYEELRKFIKKYGFAERHDITFARARVFWKCGEYKKAIEKYHVIEAILKPGHKEYWTAVIERLECSFEGYKHDYEAMANLLKQIEEYLKNPKGMTYFEVKVLKLLRRKVIRELRR